MSAPSIDRFRGKVALVTGASSGIGRAVALERARAGMRVAVCARRVERLEALAEEIRRDAPSAEVLVVPADLREERAVPHLFAEVRGRFGGVDLLVNNAGFGKSASLIDGPTDAYRAMLELNVLALCLCTAEAVRDMRARGDDGHVVHISSMAAHRVPAGSGVYAATKYAVRALTEALRLELRERGSRIRVSAISPGFVETEFASVYHGREDAARETYGRFPVLSPDDIAAAVRYVVEAPPHVQVHDLLMRPTEQPG